MMSDMAARTETPDRFVVGHPFNPPYLIPLVEVVGGRHTDRAVVAWAEKFYTHAGKVCADDGPRGARLRRATASRKRCGARRCT